MYNLHISSQALLHFTSLDYTTLKERTLVSSYSFAVTPEHASLCLTMPHHASPFPTMPDHAASSGGHTDTILLVSDFYYSTSSSATTIPVTATLYFRASHKTGHKKVWLSPIQLELDILFSYFEFIKSLGHFGCSVSGDILCVLGLYWVLLSECHNLFGRR